MIKKLIVFFLLITSFFSICLAGNNLPQPEPSDKPILVIIADKMDSTEFFQSEISSIRKFLNKSACGLMSIRSGSGYTHSQGAYLTIGAGNRSIAVGKLNGVFNVTHNFSQYSAGDFWNWSTGGSNKLTSENLILPEIGLLKNQTLQSERSFIPGLLGSLFRSNHWQTILIGNSDNVSVNNRSGGYLIMDNMGIIDKGRVGNDINQKDLKFPYLYCFNVSAAIQEIEVHFGKRKLIVVDFGDFSKLDLYREQMMPSQYQHQKKLTWERFADFIDRVQQTWPVTEVNLLVFSPSLSRESWLAKKWLAPIVISSTNYQPGLLTSGTTKWKGLVSNIDILPTLLKISKIQSSAIKLPGQVIKPVQQNHFLKTLIKLNTRLNMITGQQRNIIDWYLGWVVIGWIFCILTILLKKYNYSIWSLISIAIIPLVLMVQPLFPESTWNVTGFIIMILLGSILIFFIFPKKNYFLGLSIILWFILTLDQILGWQLIRFSALGYNPAAGSRYYGMGNEFMGIYLAVSLIVSQLIADQTKKSWPLFIILPTSIGILGMPKWGVNFGGTLAAIVGFIFYSFCFFEWKTNFRKLGLLGVVGVFIFSLLGWLDASRPVDVQTHIGRFFSLVVNHDFNEISLVIFRKLAMNFKLLIVSPWTRIIALMFSSIIILKLFIKERFVNKAWYGVLGSGLAAFVFNDSGVVALGTCMAFGFNYYLMKLIEHIKLTTSKE